MCIVCLFLNFRRKTNEGLFVVDDLGEIWFLLNIRVVRVSDGVESLRLDLSVVEGDLVMQVVAVKATAADAASDNKITLAFAAFGRGLRALLIEFLEVLTVAGHGLLRAVEFDLVNEGIIAIVEADRIGCVTIAGITVLVSRLPQPGGVPAFAVVHGQPVEAELGVLIDGAPLTGLVVELPDRLRLIVEHQADALEVGGLLDGLVAIDLANAGLVRMRVAEVAEREVAGVVLEVHECVLDLVRAGGRLPEQRFAVEGRAGHYPVVIAALEVEAAVRQLALLIRLRFDAI